MTGSLARVGSVVKAQAESQKKVDGCWEEPPMGF